MTKAQFVILKDQKKIPVHFNPSEYSLAQIESGKEENYLKGDRRQRLTFTLHFDTYMKGTGPLREDVRAYTEPIAELTATEFGTRQTVAFEWGSLEFVGTIESVSQRFTMFADDGKPVRAVLEVTMEGSDKTRISPAVNLDINWSDNGWKQTVMVSNPRLLLYTNLR